MEHRQFDLTEPTRKAFVLSSLSIAAATLAQPASAQLSPLNLRVAATANDDYASAYFAQDFGFFMRAGLNVDLQTFNGGAAIAAAIAGGAIDVGISTPVSLANAYLHGVPLVIVAAGSLLRTGKVRALAVCIAKPSGIKTAKDLEGKTVAVNALKTGSEATLDAWLDAAGADRTKVRVVETNFSNMAASIERGAIDAAVISEPALTLALRQSDIAILADIDGAIAPQYLASVWFSSRDFVQKNPEPIRRFVRAIYDAQQWANAHQRETAPVLARYAKMDVDLVRSMSRSQYADRLRLGDIQPFLDVAAKYGIIRQPVFAASLVYQP